MASAGTATGENREPFDEPNAMIVDHEDPLPDDIQPPSSKSVNLIKDAVTSNVMNLDNAEPDTAVNGQFLGADIDSDTFSDDGVVPFLDNTESNIAEAESINDTNESNEDNQGEELFHATDQEAIDKNFIPKSLKELREELLGDYTLPSSPPDDRVYTQELTPSEELSLKHYTAWAQSNGTVVAYNKHKAVLENATQIPILSLYRVRRLAESLTRFHPDKVDMCHKSCIAYTGPYKDLTHCPYQSSSGLVCGEPRYKDTHNRKKPLAQVTILPVMDTIKALFANADTSKMVRHRDECLKAALDIAGKVASGQLPQERRQYSDFGNSSLHESQFKQNIFQDHRDIALALSTDGAQLTLKKHSNTWILILIILNLPPEIRYTSGNVILHLATPGPNSPGDIESFIRPLFEEMARASEGIWIWDALESSYFVHRAYIAIACGDMLGSAKINGMAGHTANYGDRFTLVQSAKSSCKRGAKSLYYPVSPPQTTIYNPGRPASYDLYNLPMRDHLKYLKVIETLDNASPSERTKITRTTGVSRLPLCAASPLFCHPTFFPLDPFHLFYENILAHIWDVWTTGSKPGDSVHLSSTNAKLFGEQIPPAMATLPPAFCGPVRDPFLKRQSQYKVYEWMALLHWYIIPIGIEVGMNSSVLQNFSDLVIAIEVAMTVSGHSDADLVRLHTVIARFLTTFEKVYVGNNPENVHRCRLCIFQLVHVPSHIKWHGSIRNCSQATCERSIGDVGRKIRSKKAPFAHLANIITEKELIRILHLYYPGLTVSQSITSSTSEISPSFSNPFTQKIPVRRADQSDFDLHAQLISSYLGLHIDDFNERMTTVRYGKVKLTNGRVLRSQLSDRLAKPARAYRWFESHTIAGAVFAEALAFYSVHFPDQTVRKLVICTPLDNVRQTLGHYRGTWSTSIQCIDIDNIIDIVGIWQGFVSKQVYMLRKHPALSMLTAVELGTDENDTADVQEYDD